MPAREEPVTVHKHLSRIADWYCRKGNGTVVGHGESGQVRIRPVDDTVENSHRWALPNRIGFHIRCEARSDGVFASPAQLLDICRRNVRQDVSPAVSAFGVTDPREIRTVDGVVDACPPGMAIRAVHRSTKWSPEILPFVSYGVSNRTRAIIPHIEACLNMISNRQHGGNGAMARHKFTGSGLNCAIYTPAWAGRSMWGSMPHGNISG